MKALTDCVSASLRQSATIDQVGNAGRSFRSFKRAPAVPLMTAGGAIVTVGSVAYKKAIPPMTVYSIWLGSFL
jgi:hypothetical protein